MSSPFVLANSQANKQKPAKSPAPKKQVHPQPRNNYLGPIERYPICDHLKLSHYGFRPKKMKLEQLGFLIEEMFTDRYEVEMQNIRAAVNKILEEDDIRKEIRDFNEFVYDFFLRRYQKNTRKAEETIVNMLATVEFYLKDCVRLRFFSGCMNYTYSADDISCFLLIRSLIEREVGVKIVSIDHKQILDLTKVALTRKQAKKVFEQFMIDEPESFVEKSFQRFAFSNLRMNNSEMIQPYEMMIHGVKEYKHLADKKLLSNAKTHHFSTNSYIDSCFMTTLNGPERKRSSIFDHKGQNHGPNQENDRPILHTFRGEQTQNIWTCSGVENLQNKYNLQNNFENANIKHPVVPVEYRVKGEEPFLYVKDKENVTPMLDVFMVGAEISSNRHHESRKNNTMDSYQGDYQEISTNRFVDFAHHTFRPLEQHDNIALGQTSRDEVDSKHSIVVADCELDKQKVSVDSSDKNYNTVLSLSDHCFQTLKRIINM